MSFGWSVGDLIAGFKLACDIYQAVSDGPRNATNEATQFFVEFRMIIECLENWDTRPGRSQQGEPVLPDALRKQCTIFIDKHMRLIREVNRDAGAVRYVRLIEEGSNSSGTMSKKQLWLKRVSFTIEQVNTLYQKVTWPSERDDVANLRESLLTSLGVATFQGVSATLDGVHGIHEKVRVMSVDMRDMREMVYMHFSGQNGTTNNASADRQPHQVEFSAPHRIDQTQPLQLPFESFEPSNTPNNAQQFQQVSPISSWPPNSQWYNNPPPAPPARVYTMETIYDGRSPEGSVRDSLSSISSGSSRTTTKSTPSVGPSPPLGPEYGVSPPIGWGLPMTKEESPVGSTMSIQGPHSQNSMSPRLSSFSYPFPESFYVKTHLPVTLYYDNRKGPTHASVVIESVSRSESGFVQSIVMSARDRKIDYVHSINPESSKLTTCETSMFPCLDNKRVMKEYDFRVQFLGSHTFRVTKTTSQGPSIDQFTGPPKYVFGNESDFLGFQYLLLQKEVKHYCDVLLIEDTDGNRQCRMETISVLYDPVCNTRSILYYRQQIGKQPGRFVEWFVNIFEEPPQPKKKSKELKLKSQNEDISLSHGQLLESQKYPSQNVAGRGARGFSMSSGQAISPPDASRKNTRASISSNSSQKSTKTTSTIKASSLDTFEPMILGLVLKFYSETECEKFWRKFTEKDNDIFSVPKYG